MKIDSSSRSLHLIVSLVSFGLIALLAGPALAEVPVSITQQGRLLDNGEPLTGSQELEFELYDEESGGAVLWSDSVNADLDENGVYTVTLGTDANPIDAEILQDGEVYLELEIDGNVFADRLRLTSVPFATLAGTAAVAQSVVDGGVTSNALEPGAVTADALAPSAVTDDAVESLDWEKLTGIPSEVFEGSDTLAALSCNPDDLVVYDGSDWICAESIDWEQLTGIPSEVFEGGDTLAELSCSSDDLVVYDGSDWDCASGYLRGDSSVSISGNAHLTGHLLIDSNDSSNYANLYFRGTSGGDDGSPRLYHGDAEETFFLQGADTLWLGRSNEPMDLIARGNIETDGYLHVNPNGEALNSSIRFSPVSNRTFTYNDSNDFSRVNHDLSVQGDLTVVGSKSFVQPHPQNPSKQINYIAQESGEAGVYWRGSAETNDGKAVIDLPDHFSMVTSESEELTATVTPRQQWAPLYVVSADPNQLVVGLDESYSAGDVEFDFHIQGVRAGYEKHDPIEANFLFTTEGMESLEQFAEEMRRQPHIQELLIQNGILNPDGSVNERTVEEMGW